jgi:hypothetical protein
MLFAEEESTMPGRKKIRPLVGAAAVIHETSAAVRAAPIIERPDGFYWLTADGRQEFGPFATIEDARADRDRGDEESPVPGETLQEAEHEIGIADWIDPETGAPAEGQSPPHLEID